MTRRCNSRALTLVEVMVSGLVFSVFLTMVGRAVVVGYKAQGSVSLKLQAVREASLALGLVVRDAEASGLMSKMNMGAPPVPIGTTPTTPTAASELRIDRWENSGPPPTPPLEVTVGYWFDPGSGVPGEGLVRRTIYDKSTGLPVAGESAAGRVLVRNVRDFRVYRETVGTLEMVRAEIEVATVSRPVTAAVALEVPVP